MSQDLHAELNWGKNLDVSALEEKQKISGCHPKFPCTASLILYGHK